MFLRCEAVRWVDDRTYPVVIEVALTDVTGTRQLLVDKEPMFGGAGSLTASTPLPVAVTVFCELLEVDGEEALITTASPHGVETEDGRTEFRVRLDQLGEVIAPSNELLDQAARLFMGRAAGEAYLRSPTSLAFVAVVGSEVVGWCWGFQLPRPDGASMLYVHQLEVAESSRRLGIGRELVRTFMTAGAAAGATKMFLTTGADNTGARAVYDSLGGGLAEQGPTVNYWFLLDGRV
ncbi:GNAT family N-acetyltransferase [Kribbella sp. DT2]|uniref:GNAT family N-acetyltransferase n=1 Tax=Kribbella sp. DT2 TaxID=3393427 RepID=UPI003CEDFBF4